MINRSITVHAVKQQDTDKTEEDLQLAPNAFFVELHALDVLETSARANILEFLCSKISKGGRLIITGLDGLELCRQIFYGETSLGDTDFKSINRLFSIPNLKQYFMEREGWTVEFAGLQHHRYLIRVKRHEN